MVTTTSRRLDLYQALAGAITADHDVAVIHSSLLHLRLAPDGLKWDLLAALRMLLEGGKTLAVPAFTLSFCRGRAFDLRSSPSEAGPLGTWLLELAGAHRTPHPIYSFAVAGPRAGEFMSCANSTTFGDDSVFALCERLNARLVMLGCDWGACTQFHRYEEAAQVPYRRYKTFIAPADLGDGPRSTAVRMFVRDLELDPVNEYTPSVERLARAGRLHTQPLGAGSIQSASCGDLAAVCRELLAADPLAFVRHRRAVDYALHRRGQAARTVKVALIGARNTALLDRAVSEMLPAHLPDAGVSVYSVPYGQVFQEALSPASGLSRFAADFTFFVDRLEDIAQVDSLDELRGRDDLPERFARHLDLVRGYRERAGGTIVINTFINTQGPALGLADGGAEDGIAAIVARCNRQLEGAFGPPADRPVQLLRLDQAAALFEGGAIFDPRIWYLGRFPFSQAFTDYLARRYCGIVLAALGRTTRLVVVDLDGTLWGGVLGEDGIAGLTIGGDYPGNAFAAFQRALKTLAGRGVAVAIASKNDEGYALQALRDRPEMVLHERDVVAHRINWRPKWGNVEEMAAELGVGLEAVLFVDDSPAEREEMRQHLPAVKVLDLPPDPARYAAALLGSPYLECLSVTREDLARIHRYQVRRNVEQTRARFERAEDFYASLGSTLHIFPLEAGNIARAEQLVNKTNQFNATTRRYTRDQLDSMRGTGGGVYVIGLEDRFSAVENIGVVIIRWHDPQPGWAEIDSFLLSCRVLGRGVETAVLSWLVRLAAARGMTGLAGRIVPTERNTPVRSVYRDHGFTPGPADGEWRVVLAEVPRGMPSWIAVIDHTQAAPPRRVTGHRST